MCKHNFVIIYHNKSNRFWNVSWHFFFSILIHQCLWLTSQHGACTAREKYIHNFYWKICHMCISSWGRPELEVHVSPRWTVCKVGFLCMPSILIFVDGDLSMSCFGPPESGIQLSWPAGFLIASGWWLRSHAVRSAIFPHDRVRRRTLHAGLFHSDKPGLLVFLR